MHTLQSFYKLNILSHFFFSVKKKICSTRGDSMHQEQGTCESTTVVLSNRYCSSD